MSALLSKEENVSLWGPFQLFRDEGTLMLHPRCLRTDLQRRSVSMDEVVDRVIHTFGMMRNLDEAGLREARESVDNYIATLSSAGETDPKRLAVYGLAYLRNRHDGTSPGVTGC
jgi:hypothetical protein